MEHTLASSAGPTADEQRKRLEPRNTDDEEPDRKKRLTIPDSSPMLDLVVTGDVDGEQDVSEMQGPHAVENPDGQVKGELDPAKVREVREEEFQELETRVYVEVDEAEALKVSGKAPPVCGGLMSENRQENIVVDWWRMTSGRKAELVIAAAERCRRGYLVKVMMINIKKAHLYAPVEGSVYVNLPPERQTPGRCTSSTLCTGCGKAPGIGRKSTARR